MKLDATTVKALPAPASGNKVHYDDEIAGFGCRVTAAGVKSFVLNYRIAGRERRYSIGRFPAWSVSLAREEAKNLRRRIDRGDDPLKERQENREAPTVGDLIDEFEKSHLAKKRPRTSAEYKRLLERLVRPELGSMKVAEVELSDIDRLHRRISRNAPYQANRVVAVISKMFALGMTLKWAAANPVKGLERNHEDRRSRYLSPEEIAHLSIALAEHHNQRSANAIRLLLLTGARRMEVLAATWDQFDLSKGVWVKPSSHTKQKKEHRIPLSAPALQLLTEMNTKSNSRFLFPGDSLKGDEETHQTDIKKAWDSIRRRATVHLWASQADTPAGAIVKRLTLQGALPDYLEVIEHAAAHKIELPPGLTDCRLHDLRHSYASILASAGLSLPVIGALLGHSQPATTARYAHLFDDPLRAATEQVGAVITRAKPRPAATSSKSEGKA